MIEQTAEELAAAIPPIKLAEMYLELRAVLERIEQATLMHEAEQETKQ